MKTEEMYTIKEAAGKVNVAEHVLRYWEEELGISVERNSQGYRCYSDENVVLFENVKKWKEQGLQLKAIRMMLTQDVTFPTERKPQESVAAAFARTAARSDAVTDALLRPPAIEQEASLPGIEPDTQQGERAARLQFLLENLVSRAVRENNELVLKELDYQFRQFEENAEARDLHQREREEEHYRKLDELLCQKSRKKEKRKWKFI